MNSVLHRMYKICSAVKEIHNLGDYMLIDSIIAELSCIYLSLLWVIGTHVIPRIHLHDLNI